jgi:2-deoxy-D-gluconate 3-dehydrogenase
MSAPRSPSWDSKYTINAKRGRGKIIFTASLLSFRGGINVPGYVAARHGIAGLTRALANEWPVRV